MNLKRAGLEVFEVPGHAPLMLVPAGPRQVAERRIPKTESEIPSRRLLRDVGAGRIRGNGENVVLAVPAVDLDNLQLEAALAALDRHGDGRAGPPRKCS